jgi:hypothetical protein
MLTKLDNLKSLDISNNNLCNILGIYDKNLDKCLQELNLSGNRLT